MGRIVVTVANAHSEPGIQWPKKPSLPGTSRQLPAFADLLRALDGA